MDEQPIFTLKGQDITAHLVVEFWVVVQQRMRELLDAGCTLTESVETIRAVYMIPRSVTLIAGANEKETGAIEIARAMMGVERRKLAD